ncbi:MULTISPECIES: ParB/RepB/Spo0J family partition protein [unclassified Pseudonocardia]|uniref:ParB/RepB/Spo0J family partition protein n=1 Tax=unclassified Pseudonocardia TaxID=2619320 RepID=UPI0009663A22|nr:ParB/RepB/Spo0J family partition protein [Pseudonocardia sp. Ae707_Ps1]OLM08975.1 Chromosome (plasmid) partitioning protein ParB / Stage 0 sporulation protein J [Pseudonocardia sp. Ae707_Ps1]
MGKRVNLAELAREEVEDYSPPPPPEPTPIRDTGPTAVPTPAPSPVAAAPTPEPGPETSMLTVSEIVANPLNQRGVDDMDDADFYELVSTIRGHGLLQPIVVCSVEAFRNRYPGHENDLGEAQWVALIGNRRLRAAAVAGLTRLPALINDDRVSSMYEVMLVENSHRKALGPLHEAEAMQRLLAEAEISQRALAGRIGRTPMYVSQRMALLGLIPSLREALEQGSLKVEQGRQFGSLPEDEQEAIAAAGPPYRKQPTVNPEQAAEMPRRTRRSIAVSSPARAAASIREVFTETERLELIRLLSEASIPAAAAAENSNGTTDTG